MLPPKGGCNELHFHIVSLSCVPLLQETDRIGIYSSFRKTESIKNKYALVEDIYVYR